MELSLIRVKDLIEKEIDAAAEEGITISQSEAADMLLDGLEMEEESLLRHEIDFLVRISNPANNPG